MSKLSVFGGILAMLFTWQGAAQKPTERMGQDAPR